jgi:hypothetical protein
MKELPQIKFKRQNGKIKMTNLPALLRREQAGRNAKCSRKTETSHVSGLKDKGYLDFDMQFCILMIDL